jgi:hypothetical protein
MSNPPCPEPLPFSDVISDYAEIDFTVKSQPVVSLQPVMVPVDTILSNQLGPNSNPIQSPSSTPMTYVSGFPELAPVGESNAAPLLSSYMGADINAPMTLSNPNLSFSSVNDIVNQENTIKQSFNNVENKPNKPNKPQQHIENFNSNISHKKNIIRSPNQNRSHKKSIIRSPNQNNNLANYINNKASVEHFSPKKIEHFGHANLSVMDNIVILIVLAAFIYYIVSLKTDYKVDVSKIPIANQLADNSVSVENKIIIVLAVVIALVLIRKMLK